MTEIKPCLMWYIIESDGDRGESDDAALARIGALGVDKVSGEDGDEVGDLVAVVDGGQLLRRPEMFRQHQLLRLYEHLQFPTYFSISFAAVLLLSWVLSLRARMQEVERG
jgi:hypothetical protein